MKKSYKAVCSKCGNVLDYDITDGICDKCSYYNSAPLNQTQYTSLQQNVKNQPIINAKKSEDKNSRGVEYIAESFFKNLPYTLILWAVTSSVIIGILEFYGTWRIIFNVVWFFICAGGIQFFKCKIRKKQR